MLAMQTVYVALRGEGTAVFRPVDAVWVRGEVYPLVGTNPNPADEDWLFSTLDYVRCREHTFSDGQHGLLAVERVEQGEGT